ncbi:MAG: extracellular solute-binding protein [Eubacteriales bacterium]|nr:extracellular solute-binding protein [Eubacteriales bacterium]
MPQWKKRGAALLCACALLLSGCGGQSKGAKTVSLDPKNPVAITVWHYYNGAQQEAFDQMVQEFNSTEGREQGIVVSAYSQGSVNELEANVLDSANKKVGAAELPNLFAAYADTAYAVDQLGLAADLAPYFTAEDLGEYIDGYIEEGRFSDDGSLKIFPIAKSTEIFMLNKTDWEEFAAATGASTGELATIEGVTDIAARYYEWTDGLTPGVPNDGKAFFGRDALANYMLIGAKQLGCEIFSQKDGKTVLNFDKTVIRRLWDNYYVPYISGEFAASGRFRSDDVKMGKLISFVGSSSGATFFPDAVILDDENQYPIEVEVLPAPQFEGAQPTAVQQGAGMVVTEGDEAHVYASVCFLKWFTDAARNSEFSIQSGYLPVKKSANEIDFVRENGGMSSELVERIVSVAIDTVTGNELYTTKAFAKGTDARSVLENSMSEKAQADYEAVQQLLAAGTPRAEAIAAYAADENFDNWYEATKRTLEEMVD